MSRHVISVCIFCFICATHSPCASHASVEPDRLGIGRINHHSEQLPPLDHHNGITRREKLKLGPNSDDDRFDTRTNDNGRKRRTTDLNLQDKDDEYVKKLFRRFGSDDRMTLEDFEHLVNALNLRKTLIAHEHHHDEHGEHAHSDNNINKEDVHNSNHTECGHKVNITSLLNNSSQSINQQEFKQKCPALLYSLLAEDCTENQDFKPTPNAYVWFYSILAVILISACGLLALVVIPLMQKRFYKPLIQFLVALAVGTLAGDALLHLLPHAMTEHGHEHSHNDENMWKGFVAMMGLTFFFVMERFILLIGKWRKRNQKKQSHHSHVRVVNETCMDKYNSIPYCFQDIMQDTKSKYFDEKTGTTMVDISSNSEQSFKKSNSTTMDKPEANQNSTQCTSENTVCTESNKMLPNNHNHKHDDHQDIMVIVREHETSHHGHSHAHGHVHAAPQNFSAVAWMVIMGDGLHNFTDGMAIGAAFSGGIAGGFSTTVAVFCHELPHEMGDFAMLLKAGMSIKQAVFYNLLSSVLCIFGNVFGVWLGNTEYASSWVFAAAAGMFLYIALVDMIPELSSAHEDESNITQCLLHLSGLFLGVGIMTLIAFYEHDLKHIFKEPV